MTIGRRESSLIFKKRQHKTARNVKNLKKQKNKKPKKIVLLDGRENGADLAEPRRGDEHAPARAVLGLTLLPKTRAGLGEALAVLLGARADRAFGFIGAARGLDVEIE
jgi:hypothetical protein